MTKKEESQVESISDLDDIFICMIRGACMELRNADKHIRALGVINVVTWPEALRALLLYRAKNLYFYYVGCSKVCPCDVWVFPHLEWHTLFLFN